MLRVGLLLNQGVILARPREGPREGLEAPRPITKNSVNQLLCMYRWKPFLANRNVPGGQNVESRDCPFHPGKLFKFACRAHHVRLRTADVGQ